MINLLPTTEKQSYYYARRNLRLLKWIVSMSIGLLAMTAIVLAGQMYMDSSVDEYQARITETENKLKIQKLEDTQKRVTTMSASLKLVLQVLSKQVLFSRLIQQIGSITPSGARLSDLKINKIDGALDLSFSAVNYDKATQAYINITESSTKIFDKADIISIDCAQGETTTDNDYPCTITIKALFAKDNPFLFINQSKEKK